MSERPVAQIPEAHRTTIEHAARDRASALGLDWIDLTDAHKAAIRQNVWTEFNWSD